MKLKKDEVRDKWSYFSPFDEFSLKRTSKAQGLSNSQTSDEDQQGCQNPQFHERRQRQHRLDGGVYLLGQDDQEL